VNARSPTVERLTDGAIRRLVLPERNVRQPGRYHAKGPIDLEDNLEMYGGHQRALILRHMIFDDDH